MSYSYTVAETETRRVRLVLDDDGTTSNPREDDEYACGALTLPDNRRYLDVTRPGELAETARTRLFEGYGARYSGHHRGRYSQSEGLDVFERWVRVFHGGVTLLDTPIDGPAVVWYITPAMMRDRGFTDEQITTERMTEIVRVERDQYRAWAEGDIWGYVLEERVTFEHVRRPGTTDETRETGEEWEQVESVWGFIGSEYAEEEARAALQYAAGTDV